MVAAVTEIEKLQEMEQDASGEGIEKGGDDEFSFGYGEFAMDIEFKEVSSKQVNLGMELKTQIRFVSH